MSFKKPLFCIFLCISGLSLAENKQNKSNLVHVTQGKWNLKFYHMEYVLTPENTMKPFGENKYGPRVFEVSDGQFEVFIKKDKFPISSPAKEYIILRMESGNHPTKVALFNSIKTMLESKKGTVRVVLELPYYNPEKKELREANVFFRTAKGAYVDRLDAK